LASTFGTLLSSQGTDAHPQPRHFRSGLIGGNPSMLGRPASPVKFRSTDSTGAVRPIPALGTRHEPPVATRFRTRSSGAPDDPTTRILPSHLASTAGTPDMFLAAAPVGSATSRCPFLPARATSRTVGSRPGAVKSEEDQQLTCGDVVRRRHDHQEPPVRPGRRARPRPTIGVRAAAAATDRAAGPPAPPRRPRRRSAGC
jgi:hypothetical protein